MYLGDFRDYMVHNAGLNDTDPTVTWCPGTGESWGSSPDNTNRANYQNSTLAPYMSGQIDVYKCPGDIIPSDNGPRIRTYSMNSQMGATKNYNPDTYWSFHKSTELTGASLGPSDAFIWCEENMDTLNDALLQVDMVGNQGFFPDVPGSYHGMQVCGFSFADGHSEAHKWQTGVLKIPIVYGIGYPSAPANMLPRGVNIGNADWIWFTHHASALR